MDFALNPHSAFLSSIQLTARKVFSYPHFEYGYYLRPKLGVDSVAWFEGWPSFVVPSSVLLEQRTLIKDLYFDARSLTGELQSIRIRSHLEGDRCEDINLILALSSEEDLRENILVGIYRSYPEAHQVLIDSVVNHIGIQPLFTIKKQRRKIFFQKPTIIRNQSYGEYLAISIDYIHEIRFLGDDNAFDISQAIPSPLIIEFEWNNLERQRAMDLQTCAIESLSKHFELEPKMNRKAYEIIRSFDDNLRRPPVFSSGQK